MSKQVCRKDLKRPSRRLHQHSSDAYTGSQHPRVDIAVQFAILKDEDFLPIVVQLFLLGIVRALHCVNSLSQLCNISPKLLDFSVNFLPECRAWACTLPRARVQGEVRSFDDIPISFWVLAVASCRGCDVSRAASEGLYGRFVVHAPLSWCGAALLVRPPCVSGGGAGCGHWWLITHRRRLGLESVGPPHRGWLQMKSLAASGIGVGGTALRPVVSVALVQQSVAAREVSRSDFLLFLPCQSLCPTNSGLLLGVQWVLPLPGW
ncbi:hypothetical protein NDU88_007298 [Pleurodeles waltl]|uniref:Uncharacterized protein n=1 Tax=Pleurodeles waltl TaxID=8319 RepID=A0AAV7PL83_PLEWA|nr:hypothetical protein NDU88_007298 [Pleurodeles waltl]